VVGTWKKSQWTGRLLDDGIYQFDTEEKEARQQKCWQTPEAALRHN